MTTNLFQDLDQFKTFEDLQNSQFRSSSDNCCFTPCINLCTQTINPRPSESTPVQALSSLIIPPANAAKFNLTCFKVCMQNCKTIQTPSTTIPEGSMSFGIILIGLMFILNFKRFFN